jgi:thiol-disulfide isomerase/thioredoxin
MLRRTSFALSTLGLALSACGPGPSPGGAPPSAPSDKLGQEVGFSLPSDEGALVTVPLAGARATVLDFFGPTCGPCKEKVPALDAKRAELAKKGAKLVLVGVLGDGESTDDAKRALASWGVTAPFLVDKDGTGKREAGVTALPATLVLDASGAVKWIAPPKATADDVLAAVP